MGILIAVFITVHFLPLGMEVVSTAWGDKGGWVATAQSAHADSSENPCEGTSGSSSAARFAGTFVEKLHHAPYPYDGKVEDTGLSFFDTVDSKTGERFHTNRYGERIPEKDHYTDSSVLFHVPPCFNAQKPFFYVLYFHALRTDVQNSNRNYQLDRQIDDSGRNAILIAPQLAKDAPDSSPGKFFVKDAFKAFMEEAAGVLAGKLMVPQHREKFSQAPMILSAFSGGYKSVAFILDRGGVDSRIEGVFLMDALYEHVDKFAGWATRHAGKAFMVNVSTQGSTEKNTRELAARLAERGIHVSWTWPQIISPGAIHFSRSTVEHVLVPIWGPPKAPLTSLLTAMGS